MPAKSERQRKAVIREMTLRAVQGKRRQKKASRSFGSASMDTLKKFL